nr:hypothetical protein [Candidatus Sigynarchaeota archaeon]
MNEQGEDDSLSSYQKGINNLLHDMEKFEALIWAYVLKVNSNFHSREFPSTQIAKIIVDQLGLEKTKFPLFHKVIRVILDLWTRQGICSLVTQPKGASAKKTKEIYRFNEGGIERIKAKFIEKSIDDILQNTDINKEMQVLKTRERIIEDLKFKLKELP